jgi:hypothetical protein
MQIGEPAAEREACKQDNEPGGLPDDVEGERVEGVRRGGKLHEAEQDAAEGEEEDY